MKNIINHDYNLILACISDDPLDEHVITDAFKFAKKYNCEWQVIHITKANETLSSDSLKPIQRVLKKAEILGAKIIHIESDDFEQAAIDYALNIECADKCILIIKRQDEDTKLPSLLKKVPQLKNKQALQAKNIEIKSLVIDNSKSISYPFISPIFSYNALSGLLETIIYILIATLICIIFALSSPGILTLYGTGDLYLIYLIACVTSSLRAGMFAGLISAVISTLTINFFFLEPRFVFGAHKPQDLIGLTIFLGCASIISLISSGTRRYIMEAKQKEAYLNALQNISETLNRPLNQNEALAHIYNELKKLFGTELAFYGHSLMKGDSLSLKYPLNEPDFNDNDKQAFEKCRTEFVNTGYMTFNMPDSKWHFEPMLSTTGFKGILALNLAESPLRYDVNVTNILSSFSDFSANIIDRIDRTQSLEENKIQHEKEQLRTMLLSSVSHDLKTPLASIIGSLDVYESLNAKLSEENKKALLGTAHQEALRLDNFITNILDMAKLESGSVKINKQWVTLASTLDKGLITASPRFKGRQIFNEASKNNLQINVEPTLFTRSLVNIFDNISKYTPEGSNVFIETKTSGDSLDLIISDEGPGIESHMIEDVFNKYTRVKKQDSKIAGTGLGLPIARFIIRAHGGDITAENQEKGVSFIIRLPLFLVK